MTVSVTDDLEHAGIGAFKFYIAASSMLKIYIFGPMKNHTVSLIPAVTNGVML